MSSKKIVLILILAAMIVIPVTGLKAQFSERVFEALALEGASDDELSAALAYIGKPRGQRVEGSWDVTVTPVVPPGVAQPPPFLGHATFSGGGALFGSDRTRPFSKQHGTWAYLASDEFATTFTEDLFDAAGTFIGTLTVRTRFTLISRDEFVGVANGEARDTAGNVLFNRCSTIRGERIQLERLDPQCDGIVPPE